MFLELKFHLSLFVTFKISFYFKQYNNNAFILKFMRNKLFRDFGFLSFLNKFIELMLFSSFQFHDYNNYLITCYLEYILSSYYVNMKAK